ncbi:MAG: hypothetical protein JSW25_04905, partial [Thermoplasmata archaeon]
GVPSYYYLFPSLQVLFNLLILFYLFKMKDSFRDMDPKQMQQMQINAMEKQLEHMKKEQGEPPAEPPKEVGGDEAGDGGEGE